MRSLLIALTLAAGASPISSCDPTLLEHPLADPSQAKPDPQLLGVWAGYLNDTKATLHFVARPDGQTDAVLVADSAKDGAPVLSYQGFSVTAGGHTYLNLREKNYSDPMNNKYKLGSAYMVLRADYGADGSLNLAYLPGDALKTTAAHKLHAKSGGKPILSDKADVVLAYLATPEGQSGFKSLGIFHQAKIDFGSPPSGEK